MRHTTRSRSAKGNRLHTAVNRGVIELLEQRTLLSDTGTADPTFIIQGPASIDGGASPFGSTLSAPFTPAQVTQAYAANNITFNGATGNGSGQTIAIVDAYNDPDIITDASNFNSHFSLPQFNTSGGPTLSVLNETGCATSLPTNASPGGWDIEESLDVEWAHAMAPAANIVLLEASSNGWYDLTTTVRTAAALSGVSAVSCSWGGSEFLSESFYDSAFVTPSGHQGVTFLAGTGDTGKPGGWPAYSPNVLAVGGTALTINSDGSYGGESGWSDSGGGISALESQPAFQSGKVNGASSTMRTIPDVATDASSVSSVYVLDTFDGGWYSVYGTSLACPLWAGVIAIANQGRVLNGLTTLNGANDPTLAKIYDLPASDLHDITTGNNGYAAGTGYDLVTGLGTPIVNQVVNDLSTPPSIGSFTLSPTSVVTGASTTLTAANVIENDGSISNVKFYRETNGNAGLQIGSDTLLGTGTQSGSTWTLSTSTTGFAAGTYTYYAVATDVVGTASPVSSTTLTVTGIPAIGSFSVSPTSVVTGISATLTASSVTETGGTINNVKFYRETNGNTGLQIGSDTLLGTGTQSGSTWTLSTSTTGFAAGTYTYYAVATDVVGTASPVSSTTLTVTGIPAIGSFSVNPTSVVTGISATLTATSVTETGGTISNVKFYRETNGNAGLQIGSDTLLGTGTQSGSTWTLSTSTNGFAAGTYTYYAVATDVVGTASPVSSATLTVTNPAWLVGNGATWNAATQTLTVTGNATIIADPAASGALATVVANGPAANLAIDTQVADNPSASGTLFVHLGNLTLSNGATAEVASLDSDGNYQNTGFAAPNHATNHEALVIGTLNGVAPIFSIDAINGSALDLEDNDMIVHSGNFENIQALAFTGRNGAVGGFVDGTWNGNGLTSSAAALQFQIQGYEFTDLAVVENVDLPLGQFSSWQVGNQSEPLRDDGNDVIVKYTYCGDYAMEGYVGNDSATIFCMQFGTDPSDFFGANNDDCWASGSYNGLATIGNDDATVFCMYFGNGMTYGPAL